MRSKPTVERALVHVGCVYYNFFNQTSFLILALLFVFPIGRVAANGSTPGQQTALDFVDKLNEVILFPLIFLLSGVAVLVFFWGSFMYIANSNNEQARETGRKAILWGLIGLLVMTSAYAILRLALATFGIDGALDESTRFTPS